MVDKHKAIKLRQDGYQYKDIAAELGCSLAWCKQNLKHIEVLKDSKKLITGAIYSTKFNGLLTIIKDNGWDKVSIKFIDTDNFKIVSRSNILNGTLKDYNRPSVFGIGYIGEGVHKTTINRKKNPFYSVWTGLMRRCFDINFKNKRKTYQNCTVDKTWHNFQNFAKWALNQKYEEFWELDKDILIKGNKHYSPDTCCFVPMKINLMFNGKTLLNDSTEISTGIYKRGSIFYVYCCDGKTQKYLGKADSVQDAKNIYKFGKENIIKLTAEKYKNSIDEKVYKSMIDWKI